MRQDGRLQGISHVGRTRFLGIPLSKTLLVNRPPQLHLDALWNTEPNMNQLHIEQRQRT